MPTRSAYDAVSGTVLTAANLDSHALGWIGYLEVTSDQTTSGTTLLTLASLASVPVLASRRLRLSLTCFKVATSVASDSFEVSFTYDGGAAGGNRLIHRSSTAAEDGIQFIRQVATSTAGNKTITATIQRSGGTGVCTLTANASNPILLLVEDIGPA